MKFSPLNILICLTLLVELSPAALSPSCRKYNEVIPEFLGYTPADKVRWAKRVLDVPVDAPPGVLWHTYMSRLYKVPLTASIRQMQESQFILDRQLELRLDGLPEWLPLACLKEDIQTNVIQRALARYVYSVSIFASDEEWETAARAKYDEFQAAARLSENKLTFEDWYASKISKALFLSPDTAPGTAWAVHRRAIHILDLPECVIQKITQQWYRDEASRVLQVNPDSLPYQVLFDRYITVVSAVKTESPDRPIRWHYFI